MPAPAQSLAERSERPTTEPFRVLIVDDDAAIRTVAKRILVNGGFGVSEASDGAEALSLLHKATEPIHLVVSDIVMPRLNGVELLEHLSITFPKLPVILMTGYSAADIFEKGIATPCAVLHKPFLPELLLAEVRRCLPAPSR